MEKKTVFIALKMSGIAGQIKLSGIFKYLKEKYGDTSIWNIQLARSASDVTEKCLLDAISNKTDGFIISIPNIEESLLPLVKTNIPTIIMDIYVASMERRKENIVFVQNSAEDISRDAANFFLSQGIAHSYAFLHPNPTTFWSNLRFEHFKKTLNDAGLWCDELHSPAEASRLKRPAAILAANDDTAFALLKYLSGKHIKVPSSIAVLGVDNDSLICENAVPRISSILPDFEKEGYLAAERLDSMINGELGQKRTITVGTKDIIRRESTLEHTSAGRLVRRAITFMEKHALEGITVSDVVRHMQCSRRLADLRFRQHQGRTILEAITELKLNEVRRLLISTKDKIDSIAIACGFQNPNYLKNLFKKKFSMSMSEFRNKTSQSRRGF